MSSSLGLCNLFPPFKCSSFMVGERYGEEYYWSFRPDIRGVFSPYFVPVSSLKRFIVKKDDAVKAEGCEFPNGKLVLMFDQEGPENWSHVEIYDSREELEQAYQIIFVD